MHKKTKVYKVGITGSYGGLNLGDEAILHSIISQLKASFKDRVRITVFSRNAEDTQRRHKVNKAVSVRQITRDEAIPEIQGLDLLIFGGGGILFDGEARIFLREVEIAQELKVPVMVYAVSAGPLKDPSLHELICECINRASVVTVRDREASQTLDEIGVRREIIVTADPAFLLKPEPLPVDALKIEGLEGKKPLVGMSVREPGAAAPDLKEEKYHALLANVADYVVERFNASVVFVPMERSMQDMQHSHAVVAQMLRPQRAVVLKGNFTSGQILSLMGNFQFALGMRLHFLIFAALRGVPFVALPYASKVHGFLQRLQIEMPPLNLVNAGRLIAYLDRLWDQQRMLKAQIRAVLPELKSDARRTHQIAIQLLSGELNIRTESAAEKIPA